MNEKFQAVIEKHNEQPFVFGDDEMIQSILEDVGILIEELPYLATYLDQEYKIAIRENQRNIAEKIERLHYGVNFIFEALREGDKVGYKTKYIEQIS
ncbi:hypothetical protein NYE59_31955 [Paenibacillus sp. FSL L8-0323]|uniref:hypothetical protein n=1 Tax=Paenibacillus TaxID=44249 RepID=UPI0003E267E5|nr:MULTISPECIES: hypothetical protein [Paenibacillus]ETT61309.1 hypothetical protein C171_12643 [Paenibacillus sp. FSL H8-237]